MAGTEVKPEKLSAWWRNAVILVVARVRRPDLDERPLLRGRPAHPGTRRQARPERLFSLTMTSLPASRSFSSMVSWRTVPYGDTGPTSVLTSPRNTSTLWRWILPRPMPKRLYGKELPRLTAEEKAAGLRRSPAISERESLFAGHGPVSPLLRPEASSYHRQIEKWKPISRSPPSTGGFRRA